MVCICFHPDRSVCLSHTMPSVHLQADFQSIYSLHSGRGPLRLSATKEHLQGALALGAAHAAQCSPSCCCCWPLQLSHPAYLRGVG